MKIILFHLLCVLFCSTLCFSQDCDISGSQLTVSNGLYETATISQSDGLRDGPEYKDAILYYPLNAPSSLPSVVMVSGFFSDATDIEEWGPFYASHGIVVMIIETNFLSNTPAERAVGLVDAVRTLKDENKRLNSPVFGKLDTTSFAASGWSMGGGGAQLAAKLDTSLKAVVALCPWLNNPTTENLNHPVPTLILSGENDFIAPPSLHATNQYMKTPETTEKLLFEIAGGDHSVANSPLGGNEEVGKMALAWLRLHLQDESCYCPFIIDSLYTNSQVTSLKETTLSCTILAISNENNNTSKWSIYPTKTHTNLYIDHHFDHPTKYIIYTHSGIKFSSGTLNSTDKKISFPAMESGMYFIKINDQSEKFFVF